jgi:cytochrome c-type protein NapB
MKRTFRIALTAIAAVVAAACATQSEGPLQTLRGADAAVADQAPPEHAYTGKGPGSQQPVARTFSTQPPVIPHTVEGLDQITLGQNACLSCHERESAKLVKAPAMGPSHYQDRAGKALQEVSAARYSCTLCHAPQADAKPLVGNTFTGDLTPVPQGR